jgi:hypothetical protein
MPREVGRHSEDGGERDRAETVRPLNLVVRPEAGDGRLC